MPSRLTAGTVVVMVVAAGCVTSTAHRLVLTDNPLRREAIACEARCRAEDPRPPCPALGGEECGEAPVSDRYAACLDDCPGARATDGTRCPHPDPGAICVETTKANPGAIVGWIFAGLGTLLAIFVLAVLFEFFAVLSAL